MRTTFAVAAALGAAALACGCDQDKKPSDTTATTATATTATATTAPAPAPKAAPEELAQKATKTLVEAWNAHDAAKIAAAYEPPGKLVIPGMSDFAGRDAIAGEAKQTLEAYPDFKVTVTKELVRGNTVVSEWVITGKNDGPFMGQKPSGRPMGVAGASVSTVDDDGLIREEHRYLDLPTMTSQLDPKAKAGTFRAPLAAPAGAPEIVVSKGTPEEAKALEQVKAVYTAFESNKPADLAALVTDDTTLDDYTMPATEKGQKGVKDYVSSFWTTFPDATQVTPLQFAAGDYVISEGTFTGTQKGAMGPVKPTNKSASLRFVDVFQVKEGKVAHMDSFGDSAEMLVGLGVMKPLAGGVTTAAMAAAPPGATPPAMAAAKAK